MSELKKQFSSVLTRLLPFIAPLLSLLLYLPALQYDFVVDDRFLVIENPYIKSWKYLPQMLSTDAWNVWDPGNYWRPVFSISLAVDYSLWGLNPLGFHLTNILLHALNTALLYWLVRKLQNTTCALFASVLFAVHPIQAHAVSVISTMRADLLAAFFTLLSIQAFFSRRTVLFSVALMLALLSKETSMVFPLVALFAWVIIQKDKPDSSLILAFVILGLYLMVRLSLGFSFSMIRLVFSYDASLDTRWLLAFKVLALYSRALLNLFEMPHPFWTVELPTSLGNVHVISGVLIFLFLLGVMWASLKENPVMAFGLMWFVIYFLPISNLVQLNTPMAEHWLYIPMIGLSLAFGTAMDALSLFRFSGARMVRLGVVTSVIVFLFFAVLVVREKTEVYQSEESFLTAAIRANPHIASLHSLLGNAYVAKNDIPRAKGFYTRSLTLNPGDFAANYMLGLLLYQEGRQEDAKVYLRRITSINPSQRAEFSIVAQAWEMLGDNQKALFYYRKALDVNPFSAWVQEKVAGLESR